MDDYLSVKQVADRAHMSQRIIMRFLHSRDLPHTRFSSRGKIWIRWDDFQQFMTQRRVRIRADKDVCAILADLRAARG